MPFKPGESGNPNGRPRQKPLLEWCKKWTLEKAETVLGPIAEDPKRKDQLEAIKTIMAYGIGKPVESVESTHQFEGLDANPHQAKDFLGQLIAGETIASVGLGEGSGDEQANSTAQVPGPERGAGESNSGDRGNGELHNGA